MHRKIFLLVAAVATFALPGLAQNSKLNGTWKLNVAKSDFGQFPPPGGETDVIDIKGADFKQHVTSESPRGASQYTRACTIDGKDTPLTPDNPNAHIGPVLLTKILCAWEGSSLVITEGASMGGSDLTDKLTYSVSGDGNILTLTSHITSARMNGDRKMLYDRQTASATADPPAAAAPAASASRPNLTGSWKLNAAKSNFGTMGAPDSGVETIVDNEPSVKVTVDQKGGMMGDVNYTESISTDGKETTWAGMGGAEVKGTGHWDGATLVVNAKTSFQGSDVTIKDTYKVSDDGKSLTVATHAETSMGNFDATAVFDKL
ncbi:MAG: hypothetical protein LAN59_05620 [Acidobacteriia bacterium]|nr:hypothetical protein [Terriglobia bacterium]